MKYAFEISMALSIAFLVGLLVGYSVKENEWFEESVKSGHAEYVLEGNKAKWQWKQPAGKE